MLFVTHNPEEAQDLGDRMGVMTKGRRNPFLYRPRIPFTEY